ncbi:MULTISPECIES: hypothetical protein [Burkholderia]|uniref:hypothetical protein n=1 Tax=Burkholderia TaxID=32008 RepID=UPI000B7A023D|nr:MULTISPECIES: hypothetical protein [Burkholderia]MBR7944632.1 hypothetical protein [Burkholderia cenocepacia]OXJ22676.1 hypothetical protein CFB82_39095 [Burkholderia sp. HI2714]CAG2382988.1 hypothetical protein BCCR12632_07209 [Burkholderia cenocepacia]CAG2382994.1 hypothetical protein BCCR75389_07166 [Burkholderia cenocepacia]CAG2383005.1 hypothetical protein BCCR75388_07174 [Burkholderia cenocepacia]
MSLKAVERPILTTALTTGTLYRAFVVLPDALCQSRGSYEERTVFFEAPRGADEAAHLQRLLAHAWCVDTQDWAEDGAIYNIYSAAELYADKTDPTVDLRLLDIGGGPDGVGPTKAYYARTADVDLFVTPRVAARLRELLAIVDSFYEKAGQTPAN